MRRRRDRVYNGYTYNIVYDIIINYYIRAANGRFEIGTYRYTIIVIVEFPIVGLSEICVNRL